MNHSRLARPMALLVHGMGANPAWWSPVTQALEDAGLEVNPLEFSSLENEGPEAWCEYVLSHMGNEPVVLIGHSLGAAVCLSVNSVRPAAKLVLLACPPFLPDFTPLPPPETGLSRRTIARVEQFLKATCTSVCSLAAEQVGALTPNGTGVRAPEISGRAIHFVGARDPWVPVEQARRLPIPLVVIPDAGHGLNRHPGLIAQLTRFVVSAPSGR